MQRASPASTSSMSFDRGVLLRIVASASCSLRGVGPPRRLARARFSSQAPRRAILRSAIVAESLIQVDGLRKVYRQGFWMRRVEAVRGISFRVSRGEAFGFLGPNGAGKTTTIKILMGLMRPTGGDVRL